MSERGGAPLRRLVALFALAAGVAASATAATAADPLTYLPAARQPEVSGVLDTVARLRSSMAGHRFVDSVRGILEAGNTVPPVVPALPAPATRDLTLVSPLPAGLQAPVAGLWSAVRQAEGTLGSLPAPEVQAEVTRLFQGLGTLQDRAESAPTQALTAPWDGRVVERVASPVSPAGSIGDLGAATAQAVRADPEAALLVAEALDLYLPQLEAAAAEVPSAAGTTASGCDLLDLTPELCVGSSANNTYSANEVLLIDLGGGDTYRNTAGGAPFLPTPGAPAFLPVSVNVDLGAGADAYAPAPATLLSAEQSGQYNELVMGEGAGVMGGLGVSVDTGGDSTYDANGQLPALPTDQQRFPRSAVLAQGAGAIGMGFLFDLGGNDSYRARMPTVAHSAQTAVFAQGAGMFDANTGCNGLPFARTDIPPSCSYGAVVDWGGGNDGYAIDGGGYVNPAPATALFADAGQGAAAISLGSQGSTGLVFDDGGTDAFTSLLSSHTAGGTSTAPFSGPTMWLEAQGFGTGDGANGLLVEGAGDTTYRIQDDSEGLVSANDDVSGQAAGVVGGLGALSDDGGHDAYLLQGTITAKQTYTAPPCAKGVPCPTPSVSVMANSSGFPSDTVQGQGFGGGFIGTGGVGVLDERGGAVSYWAVARTSLDVHLNDQRNHPATPASLTVIGFLSPFVQAQGVGYEGVGVLVNRSGHADYKFTSSDPVAASASYKGTTPRVAATSPFMELSTAQGGVVWDAQPYGQGFGALLDLGGPGDTFSAVQTSPATASPNTGGAITLGGFWPIFQGAGSDGLLVAAGASPRIFSSPANGVCPASPSFRGFGTWVDCASNADNQPPPDADHRIYDFLGGFYDPGKSQGQAPNATGAAPSLRFVSVPTVVTDGTSTPVTVQLVDPKGRAIAGAPVHVDLQYGFIFDPTELAPLVQWYDFSQAEAVTGTNGQATATLPIDLGYLGIHSIDSSKAVQILATFDGASELYPRHVSSPVTVKFG